jgi:hypothetical protein
LKSTVYRYTRSNRSAVLGAEARCWELVLLYGCMILLQVVGSATCDGTKIKLHNC